MLFWVDAASFDRLQRVRAQEKESSAFSDNCLVFIPRNVWSVESQDEYPYFFQTSVLACSASVTVLLSFSRDKANPGYY